MAADAGDDDSAAHGPRYAATRGELARPQQLSVGDESSMKPPNPAASRFIVRIVGIALLFFGLGFSVLLSHAFFEKPTFTRATAWYLPSAA